MAELLRIRHVPGDGETPRFEVERPSDGRRTQPAPIQSPAAFPVEGSPGTNLLAELRWYLETFLEYTPSSVSRWLFRHKPRVSEGWRRYELTTTSYAPTGRKGEKK